MQGIFIDSANHGQHRFRPHAGMTAHNVKYTVANWTVIKSLSEVSHPFDYIVFAHKAVDQDAVAAQLQLAVDVDTTLVIIQNGVGNEEPFRRLYPETSIISCVVCIFLYTRQCERDTHERRHG